MRKPFVYLILLFSTIINAQEITVEKIWKNFEFSGARVAGFRSMKDGLHFTKREPWEGEDAIVKHSFADPLQKGELLISLANLTLDGKKLTVDDYEFNADETKVLFTTQTISVYRHSFFAAYFVYDLKTKKLEALDKIHTPQMLAEYSPDGTQVSYLFENNLYVKNLISGKVKQLTKDGQRNCIINGGTDWVYEEEFGLTKAYTWSPDSKNIAFLRFDESKVKEFNMTFYHDLYPELYTFKYPKAGEDNSKVSLHIVELKKGKIQHLQLGAYEYIPRLKWSSTENTLVVQSLNRHQNELKYHKISQLKGKWMDHVFYTETASTYIDIDDNLLILKDGKTILRTSEKDGYNHIYALKFDGSIQAITSGSWDVIEFLGIDEEKQKVYYSSAEAGAIHKGIYSVLLNGHQKTAISSETGYNHAEFSKGMKYFLKTYSEANTPPVYSLCDSDGKELFVLESNEKLKKVLANYSLATQEFLQIQGHDQKLNAYILKPRNFDPNKKYPVYLHIYGGPGSNMVKNTFGGADYMYHQLLVQKGYIVVSVDPRGTMYRGAQFKKSTYLNLGKLETEDFIAAMKNFSKESYVDATRIGIMGWSYGGFMTSLCMTKGADVFKMGIAVAPVTNWRYYDNIYTERFMRTPKENEKGYDDNSPIHFVNQLKGKYLLVHGSADDNVHYQNTMEMIDTLVAANKDFDLFVYPNKNHGIYGGNTRNHLFQKMLQFTLENL